MSRSHYRFIAVGLVAGTLFLLIVGSLNGLTGVVAMTMIRLGLILLSSVMHSGSLSLLLGAVAIIILALTAYINGATTWNVVRPTRGRRWAINGHEK